MCIDSKDIWKELVNIYFMFEHSDKFVFHTKGGIDIFYYVFGFLQILDMYNWQYYYDKNMDGDRQKER